MGSMMKTASEYRQHAGECRTLAHQMPAGEQRDQLLEMARTWDSLAETREGLVHRILNSTRASAQAAVEVRIPQARMIDFTAVRPGLYLT
jgi:hypothetical protein